MVQKELSLETAQNIVCGKCPARAKPGCMRGNPRPEIINLATNKQKCGQKTTVTGQPIYIQ